MTTPIIESRAVPMPAKVPPPLDVWDVYYVSCGKWKPHDGGPWTNEKQAMHVAGLADLPARLIHITDQPQPDNRDERIVALREAIREAMSFRSASNGDYLILRDALAADDAAKRGGE